MDKKEEEGLVRVEDKISMESIAKMHQGIIAIIENDVDKVLIKRQQFQRLLDKNPRKEVIKKHPFIRNVNYLPISHVEGLLDAIYFGQWNTRNFKWELIGNELSGSIELTYIDPITNRERVLTGTAAEQIQVNAIPKDEKDKMSKVDQSRHALDLQNNKKPAALKGAIGTLKTDCIKNACKSIGNAFGRNINREVIATPFQILPTSYDAIHETLNSDDAGE